MVRLFEYEDGKCMHTDELCNGKCDLRNCPERTEENMWRATNAIYGIKGRIEFPSRFPKVSVINLCRFDNITLKDIVKQLKQPERVYVDTDSEYIIRE